MRVYLKDGKTATAVTANGEPLFYNNEYNRWELVISDFEDGDALTISVIAADEEGTVQEKALIIKEL